MKKKTPGESSSEQKQQANSTPKEPQINFSRQDAKKTNTITNPKQEPTQKNDLRQSKPKGKSKAQQRNEYEQSLPYYKRFFEKIDESSKTPQKSRQNFLMKLQQKPGYSRFNRSPSLGWSHMIQYWGKDLSKQIISHVEDCPIFKQGTQRNSSKSKSKFPQVYKETQCDCTTNPQKIALAQKQKEQRKQALKIKIQEYNKFQSDQTPQKQLKNQSPVKTTLQKEQNNTIPSTPLKKNKTIKEKLNSSPRNINEKENSSTRNIYEKVKSSPRNISQKKNYRLKISQVNHFLKMTTKIQFFDTSLSVNMKNQCQTNQHLNTKLNGDEKETPSSEQKKKEFIRKLFRDENPFAYEVQSINERSQATQRANPKSPLQQQYSNTNSDSPTSEDRSFAKKYLPQYPTPKQKNRQSQMEFPVVANSEETPNVQSPKRTINQNEMRQQNQTPKRKTNNQLLQKLARGQILKNQDPEFVKKLKSLSTSNHLLDFWADQRFIQLDINDAMTRQDMELLRDLKLQLDDSTANYELNVSEKDFKERMRRQTRKKYSRDPDHQELQYLWSLKSLLIKQIKDRIRSCEDKIVDYETSQKKSPVQEKKKQQRKEQRQFKEVESKQELDQWNDSWINAKKKVQSPPQHWKNYPKRTRNSPQSHKYSTPQRQKYIMRQCKGSPSSSVKSKYQQTKQQQQNQQKTNKMKLLEKHKEIPKDIDLQKALIESYSLSMSVNPSDNLEFQLMNKSSQYILRGLQQTKRLKEKKQQAEKLLKKAQEIIDETESQRQFTKLNTKFHEDQLTLEQLYQITQANEKRKLLKMSLNQYFRQPEEESELILPKILKPHTLNQLIPKEKSPLMSGSPDRKAQKKKKLDKENSQPQKIKPNQKQFLSSDKKSINESNRKEKHTMPSEPKREYSELKVQMEVLKMIQDKEDRKQLEKNLVKNSIRKTDIKFQRSIKKQDNIIQENLQSQVNESRQHIIQESPREPSGQNSPYFGQPLIQKPAQRRRQQMYLNAFQQVQQRQAPHEEGRPNQQQQNVSGVQNINPNRRPRMRIGGGGDGDGGDSDDPQNDRNRDTNRDNRNNRDNGDPPNPNGPNLPPFNQEQDYAKMILDSVPHYQQLLDIFVDSIDLDNAIEECNNKLLQFRLTLFANYAMVCCQYYPTQMKKRIRNFWRKDAQILNYFKNKDLYIPQPFQNVIALLSIGILQYSNTFCPQEPTLLPNLISDMQYQVWQVMFEEVEYRRFKNQQRLIRHGVQKERQEARKKQQQYIQRQRQMQEQQQRYQQYWQQRGGQQPGQQNWQQQAQKREGKKPGQSNWQQQAQKRGSQQQNP